MIAPQFQKGKSKVFEKSYKFQDVAIQQKKCIVNSRSEVDIESEVIRGIKLSIPIISSNMVDVTNSNLAIKLYKLGGLGILHRGFPNEDDYVSEVQEITKKIPIVAVSIGVGANDCFLLNKLIKEGSNLICIDVAHAYSNKTLEVCKHIKNLYPNIKIIVGNTINPDAIEFFNDYVDAIKIGCATGSACETRNTSGCYKPQFSAVYDMKMKAEKYGMPLISDGGIREPADFSKSIGAGASSAMGGYIFARCPESAAETIEIDGVQKKIMRGMASRSIQEKWKGKVSNSCPEGKTTFLDIGEPLVNLIQRYSGALRSGISYAGFNNVNDFRKNCEFILI